MSPTSTKFCEILYLCQLSLLLFDAFMLRDGSFLPGSDIHWRVRSKSEPKLCRLRGNQTSRGKRFLKLKKESRTYWITETFPNQAAAFTDPTRPRYNISATWRLQGPLPCLWQRSSIEPRSRGFSHSQSGHFNDVLVIHVAPSHLAISAATTAAAAAAKCPIATALWCGAEHRALVAAAGERSSVGWFWQNIVGTVPRIVYISSRHSTKIRCRLTDSDAVVTPHRTVCWTVCCRTPLDKRLAVGCVLSRGNASTRRWRILNRDLGEATRPRRNGGTAAWGHPHWRTHTRTHYNNDVTSSRRTRATRRRQLQQQESEDVRMARHRRISAKCANNKLLLPLATL
jgi:hypothetical protein